MKAALLLLAISGAAFAAEEIPLPPIPVTAAPLPGVDQLPSHPTLPPLKTREEMRRILAWYAVGHMPPPPGKVKSTTLKTETTDAANYRLVRLSFSPNLTLDIGIFTPKNTKRAPAIIWMNNTPPGATPLPRLPQGPNQGRGENVLTLVGPPPSDSKPAPTRPPETAQAIAAARAEVFRRGYALIVYNPNDCAEDTTLRNLDGSWAYRTTRFPAAYPNYDWGILAAWAWGASRIADYLSTDPAIDKRNLIVTGASRYGKAAMIAAAFDDRLGAAPVVTGGGGIGAYRLCGPRKSETLDIMELKYPNWFSPHLRQFRGHVDKLPFDQHWFLALTAPRPFIALEGTTDTISLPEAVKASIDAAKPAYDRLGVPDRIAIHYSNHGHAFTEEDWTALLDFLDRHLH